MLRIRLAKRVLASSLLFVGVLACGNAGSGGSAEGELRVRFVHRNDGAVLAIGPLVYLNEAGNEYSVRTFEYLVTDIRLVRADGRKVDVARAIQGNAVTLGEIEHVFEDVPAGRYAGIEFRWGVDPDFNENFYLDSSFDNLLWPPNLGGGYHNMRFEGDWTETMPGGSSFALHSGYLRRCRDMMVSFEACPPADRLEYQGSFVVRLGGFSVGLGADNRVDIDIAIDVDRWMNDPQIDLREPWSDQTICPVGVCTLAGRSMMNPETQSLLRDNGDDVFSIVSVLQGP